LYKKTKEEYAKARDEHANRREEKEYVSYPEARANKFKIDWANTNIAKPNTLGNVYFEEYPIEEIRKYIDWTPFFQTWMLQGKYPKIFENEIIGKEAKKLFEDANKMLDNIIEGKWLTCKAALGIYPANSIHDEEVEVYADESRSNVLHTFQFLRQQGKKGTNVPNLSLSDFIAPKDSGKADYLGFFAVTAGIGIESLLDNYKKDHDDYHEIMLKAVADRLAEALTEHMHEKVRKEIWGYASTEKLENEQLIREEYVGIRPAPGYPACPDHTEKPPLFELLDATKNTGIFLTESNAMYPASSVSGMYFAHPDSKYFGLGKIAKDQVESYANRKGLSVQEAERWLAPNLNYDV
jgi:5-methyltetrahydrofolate--homocysteine methyltransferase